MRHARTWIPKSAQAPAEVARLSSALLRRPQAARAGIDLALTYPAFEDGAQHVFERVERAFREASPSEAV
jgi:hypothetical protein